jgi:AP-4 complex subunit mu-1
LENSLFSGNPDLRLGLNEDLVIGRGGSAGYGAVALEDVNFNDVCRLDHFESERVLEFTPPEGEFVVLNYRVAGEFRVPFRVFSIIDEDLSVARLEVLLKVRVYSLCLALDSTLLACFCF